MNFPRVNGTRVINNCKIVALSENVLCLVRFDLVLWYFSYVI